MSNIDCSQITEIKEKIQIINSTSNIIHVTMNNKRKTVTNAVSKILSIHDRFLCIESKVNNYIEKFTINYIDIIIGNFSIKELII